MGKKSTVYTDQELIACLKSNEKSAFEYLYDHYGAALYGIICKIVKDPDDANDVMQDAFLKIWRNIRFYNAEKGTLFTWILNIARNTAIDKLRADVKYQNDLNWINVSEGQLMPAAIVTPSTSAMDIRHWVDTLLPEKKQLIEIVYFQGYTHQEAAEFLGIPLGTVKSRIRAALQEMRSIFDLPCAKFELA